MYGLVWLYNYWNNIRFIFNKQLRMRVYFLVIDRKNKIKLKIVNIKSSGNKFIGKIVDFYRIYFYFGVYFIVIFD